MARHTVGIDISDDLLSAVVVAGKGRDARVVACASVLLEGHDDLPAVLPVLLEELQWKGGDCVSGLPLSYFSLRNLTLPFSSEKKLQQILPLELEEHLLSPVAEQVFATTITGESDSGSHLLVAAIAKATLQKHLETFRENDLEPMVICPSSFALADRLSRTASDKQNCLLLYTDMGSMTMIICHQGKIVFMRRLSYPEKVFTDAIFSFDGNSVRVADSEAADAAVSGLCQVVKRSIDYYRILSREEAHPKHVVFAGPLQLAPGVPEKIEHYLGLSGTLCNLAETGQASLAPGIVRKWQPAIHDRPLALALQGGRKQVPFDVRKGEFAARRHLLGSRRRIATVVATVALVFAVLFGYLLADYHSLQQRHDGLSGEISRIFSETFPGIDPGKAPLMHMRSKLQEVQAPTVSMPLFTQEKRILALLADISARIPATVSIHVSRLVIDQDTVKIQGTTGAFNNVNTIKEVLDVSPRYSGVNIVSATKGKEKNLIRFEITLQLEETS